MHEYSIVQSLLERIELEATALGATAVCSVSLRIGAQSGVEPVLLSRAFEMFRDRSVCRDAQLAVTIVPARWVCPSCRRGVEAGAVLRCPRCARPAALVEGDEIILDRLEMEVPDV